MVGYLHRLIDSLEVKTARPLVLRLDLEPTDHILNLVLLVSLLVSVVDGVIRVPFLIALIVSLQLGKVELETVD